MIALPRPQLWTPWGGGPPAFWTAGKGQRKPNGKLPRNTSSSGSGTEGKTPRNTGDASNCCCGCVGVNCPACGDDGSPDAFTLVASGINTINRTCVVCPNINAITITGTYVNDGYCLDQYALPAGAWLPGSMAYCHWKYRQTGYSDIILSVYPDTSPCVALQCQTDVLEVEIFFYVLSAQYRLNVSINAVFSDFGASCNGFLPPVQALEIFYYDGLVGATHPCRDTLTFDNQLNGLNCGDVGFVGENMVSSDSGTVTISPCCTL